MSSVASCDVLLAGAAPWEAIFVHVPPFNVMPEEKQLEAVRVRSRRLAPSARSSKVGLARGFTLGSLQVAGWGSVLARKHDERQASAGNSRERGLSQRPTHE